MLRTPRFWLLYGMMVLIAMGGLMATAQIGPIAKDFKVADTPISVGFLAIAALPLALSIDRVLNGITRPFWGWISDRVGRERTMTIAFGSEAVMIALLILTASHPVLFVVFSGLTFFSWGEIYSLFPSLSSDLFGRQYATTNYGLLYTAKGTASLLVPIGSVLQAATGSWLRMRLHDDPLAQGHGRRTTHAAADDLRLRSQAADLAPGAVLLLAFQLF